MRGSAAIRGSRGYTGRAIITASGVACVRALTDTASVYSRSMMRQGAASRSDFPVSPAVHPSRHVRDPGRRRFGHGLATNVSAHARLHLPVLAAGADEDVPPPAVPGAAIASMALDPTVPTAR
jgi:hypothetical protein